MLISNVRMFVMITMMMTMMYFYCEKEISEVLVQGAGHTEEKSREVICWYDQRNVAWCEASALIDRWQ